MDLVESEKVALEAEEQQISEQNAVSGPTPQAAKALAKADTTKKQWVNGERYVYSDTEAGPQWVLDYSTVPGRQVGSTGLSGMFTAGTTKSRATNAYTGADSGAAAGNVGAKIVNGKAVPPAAKTGQAAQPAKVPAKPDPKVLALQKELIAKGAQIKADGIMGPKTQAAQQQFGGQAAQPAAQPGSTEYAPFGGDTAPATQAAQPTAPPAVPQNGQMAPNTVYTGQNPGIDNATRAAAQQAVKEDQSLASIIQLAGLK